MSFGNCLETLVSFETFCSWSIQWIFQDLFLNAKAVLKFLHEKLLLGFQAFYIFDSGQIIATSHDLTPNGGLVREIPLFQGNPGWWNIIIWPDLIAFLHVASSISSGTVMPKMTCLFLAFGCPIPRKVFRMSMKVTASKPWVKCEPLPIKNPWDHGIFTDPWMLDFHGINVGKYYTSPMDPMVYFWCRRNEPRNHCHCWPTTVPFLFSHGWFWKKTIHPKAIVAFVVCVICAACVVFCSLRSQKKQTATSEVWSFFAGAKLRKNGSLFWDPQISSICQGSLEWMTNIIYIYIYYSNIMCIYVTMSKCLIVYSV